MTESEDHLRALSRREIGPADVQAARWAVPELDRLRARVAELEARHGKVYTVESGGCKDFHGVFSAREEAEGWARAILSTYADATIEEWDLDPPSVT